MEYDFAIIGAGPSGTVVARGLQSKGKKCVILEKKEKLEEKTCGGLLTWSGLKCLEKQNIDYMELLDIGGVKLTGFNLINQNVHEVHKYHVGEFGIGIQRNKLDNWLLKKAEEMGVNILMGHDIKEYCFKNNAYIIDGIHAKNIIFATGARGYCPQNKKSKLSEQSFGLSEQIKCTSTLNANQVYFWFFENGSKNYFWAIPNGNNIWNFGIWFYEIPKNPVKLYAYYKKKIIPKYFENFQIIKHLSGAFCGNVNLGEDLPNHIYGIGDFAGNNLKKNGEGLRYAIESAIKLIDNIEC